MNHDEALEKAQEIVEYLFTNGFGEQADRLAMLAKNGKEIGGWGKAAVKDFLVKTLEG